MNLRWNLTCYPMSAQYYKLTLVCPTYYLANQPLYELKSYPKLVSLTPRFIRRLSGGFLFMYKVDRWKIIQALNRHVTILLLHSVYPPLPCAAMKLVRYFSQVQKKNMPKFCIITWYRSGSHCVCVGNEIKYDGLYSVKSLQ